MARMTHSGGSSGRAQRVNVCLCLSQVLSDFLRADHIAVESIFIHLQRDPLILQIADYCSNILDEWHGFSTLCQLGLVQWAFRGSRIENSLDHFKGDKGYNRVSVAIGERVRLVCIYEKV